MKIIRPIEHLSACNSLYSNAWHMVDEFRLQRGKTLPKWPDWCFLPMAAWYSIVCAENGVERLGPDLVGDVARLAAIGTWRYTQGIYRFDTDLQSALAESTVRGELPSEGLRRLPEWCLYFETPDRQWGGQTLYGFWVHLEWDTNTERTELRLLLDCEESLIPIPIHVGDWTVTEAVDRAVAEAAKQAQSVGLQMPNSPDLVQKISEETNPLISMVLYICSESPEIDNEREPGKSPARTRPTKTKNGWKLFPPKKPNIWLVGNKIGEQLRRVDQGEVGSSERGVRPHLRRGHWHGYWVGPRDGERRFRYHWLHPMIVSGSEKNQEEK